MGPKIVYLAEPNPAVPAAEWPARWREHGEVVRSLPLWRHLWRYEQDLALPLPEEVAGLVPGPADDGRYGGVGVCQYRSEAAVEEMRDEPGHGPVREDERETFARTVEHFTVVAHEEVRREREPTGLKLITFLLRRDGSRDDFWRAWGQLIASDAVAPLLDRASAYIESRVTDRTRYPVAVADDRDRDRFPDFDGVVEVGFRDGAALAAAAADPACAAGFEAIGSLVDPSRSITVLTDEEVLYDELEQVDWLLRDLLALRRTRRGAAA
ncbi:MAG TPA: hypothetical protein VMF55_01815 [Solirubrobacterales bacterium]|nr:hypothetical protein [Solirubrobacterales bacterium]